MNVLVFGGAGFLGSYVVDELIARGHEVAVFDRAPSAWLQGRGDMVVGDVLDAKAVAKAVKGRDVVYNFAGLADLNASIADPVTTVSLNVMGNLNVLEACRAEQVDRFVYASSVYVFSRKGAFYGASKKSSELIIEQYAEQFGLPYTIIRYGSVYGERADATNRIYRILREALEDKRITFPGDGAEEREYIHGRDAAKLSADILAAEFENRNVILTGVERFKYADLLAMIREMMDNKIEIEMKGEDYEGHYTMTPYSFSPTIGVKLVNNPSIEFGQGLLECMEAVFQELHRDAAAVPGSE